MRYYYFDDTDFVVVFVNLRDQLTMDLLDVVVGDYCFDFAVATEEKKNKTKVFQTPVKLLFFLSEGVMP